MAISAPAAPPSQWADLPPDLLRDVSGRLRNAAYFVRFHAVCSPWRAAALAPTPSSSFLPWLGAPWGRYTFHLTYRCVFSGTSYTARTSCGGDYDQLISRCSRIPLTSVASADGAAKWLMLTGRAADGTARPEPMLVDPLTGAVARRLPRFPDHGFRRSMGRSAGGGGGIVYGDGTTFLYGLYCLDDYVAVFRAAVLRRGDAEWTVVERRLAVPARRARCCAAYHEGRILVSVDAYSWCVVVSPDDAEADVGGGALYNIRENGGGGGDDKYSHRIYSYVLESRGELLRASVLLHLDSRRGHEQVQDAGDGLASALSLSMSVHALEADSGEMRWARRDGRSLGDRVLFLGWPCSFAMDAEKLRGDGVPGGGCAYFVHRSRPWGPARQPCNVFRCSLVDGKAQFVERLPHEWEVDMCMWLVPQPAIAPIKDIRGRIKASKTKQQPANPIAV